jgi:hypothetical protein
MSNRCAHNESSATQSSHAEPELTESTSITNLTGSTSPQQELAQKCLKIVEDFRSSRISKSEGLVSITQIIASQSPNTSDETISFIAEPYYSMLEHWASELSQAAGPADPDVEPNAPGQVAMGENEHESSVERDEPIRKRCKLDFSCLDRAAKSYAGRPISSNLKRTNEVLLNWSQDPKEARRRLMYHECSPEFHESGWSEIVAGKCLNLDAVHTIITSSRTVDKHTETLGDIEIRYGVSEAASKKITSYTGWTTAWNRAAKALKFAFPHREDELTAYYEYIVDKFDRTSEAYHGRVIRFDKAVRNRVGSSRRYELSDFEAFRDIYDSHPVASTFPTLKTPNPVPSHGTKVPSPVENPVVNGMLANVPVVPTPVASGKLVLALLDLNGSKCK